MDWYQRLLTVGCTGDDVKLVQRKLHGHASGVFDQDTAARVRGFQRTGGLMVTGIVDATTASHIGGSVRDGMVPDWFVDGTVVDDGRMRELLGLDYRSPDLETTVRRFQSAHNLPLSGVMDEATATALGDDVPWLHR